MSIKITWLGQAGLLFETESKTILVDPYLSDSVERVNPRNYRRQPIDERFLAIAPDIILLTHNHLDHTDPETLKHYLKRDEKILVLASKHAWETVRQFGGNHNYVMFHRHTVWTEDGITFTGVYAEHSDEYAIGVLLEIEDNIYYITGDTLYHRNIFVDLPQRIDAVFLPINGEGNNMNMQDAANLCRRIGGVAIPLHCGMFDNIDMHQWQYENKIVPELYQEIVLKKDVKS